MATHKYCGFQYNAKLFLFSNRKALCCEKRVEKFHTLITVQAKTCEHWKTLLESHRITTSESSQKKRLLLSHYEVLDIFDYLESKEAETSLVHLEKPLQVHLGCKWVYQLEVTCHGLRLYLEDPDSVFLDWNALNEFLGIDSHYRPFDSLEADSVGKRKRRKRISLHNCKIRPGVLLWEQEEDDMQSTHIQRLSFYSPTTNRPITLVPVTRGTPPTAIIGGFAMHRGYSTSRPMDPAMDTRLKIDSLYPVFPKSRVLDICTGLGYTSIELLRRYPDMEQLITIELDETMVLLEEINPWSQALVQDSFGVVHRLLGDATKILPMLPDNYFQVVIHDPPAQALQGDLYSYEFYCQIARVLSPRGQLYHYIGNPNSREAGRLYQGVVDRLRRAGFQRVVKRAQAFGVIGIAPKLENWQT